jgi:putative sterol carrier protein
MYETVEDVFKNVPQFFDAAAAQGENGIYQFNIIGDSKWVVKIQNGTLYIETGECASPDCTLTINKDDYLDMVNGKESMQMLYMLGRLKVEGDLTFAVKLARYFPRR